VGPDEFEDTPRGVRLVGSNRVPLPRPDMPSRPISEFRSDSLSEVIVTTSLYYCSSSLEGRSTNVVAWPRHLPSAGREGVKPSHPGQTRYLLIP